MDANDLNIQEAREEYSRALKLGQKQAKELTQSGKSPNPAVLDQIVENLSSLPVQQIGYMEIPVDRVVGVVTSGRIAAFSAGFMPLLSAESEFGFKWINLCADHLSDTGIRDPIEVTEYLGEFYIQEGNKRLSVLKHFGAATIPAIVRRIMPERSHEPRIAAYYEFLDFFKITGMYDIQFREPGQYANLLSFLGKNPEEPWTDREKKTFSSYFQYFRDAFHDLKCGNLGLTPEAALLLWLQIHPFRELGDLTHERLKATLIPLWGDMISLASQKPMEVQTEPEKKESKGGILNRIMSSSPDHLDVAFVHQRDPETSPWTKAHDEGRKRMESVLSDKVIARTYCHADTPEQADEILEQAVADGAQVVFTTTPQLSRATLKMAGKYPKVRFFNCSADAPFASFSSYYCRAYEGKFITGAIAGAMADDNRIGYIGSYPIFGVPAAINAFALGAQMTNPRAKIVLKWSCIEGDPARKLIDQGIRVISNRDVPLSDRKYLESGQYGTYCIGADGSFEPLGSPCWEWGDLYENMVRSILSGGIEQKKSSSAVNYWWGMDSGVVDVKLAHSLPEGLLCLAGFLRDGIKGGTIEPFHRRILDQAGNERSNGIAPLTPDQILHMDWLCENVEGEIPAFEKIAPYARAMVRQLGVYRDSIPKEKEGTL